jgi:ERCC4-type nuclease
MIIKIDNRENALREICETKISDGIQLVTEMLPLGDIIINDGEKDCLIIERKTISDLSASIKDGRYEEQSYRLNGISHHNHNIIYLIEGELDGFVAKACKHKIDKMTIYSAMFSINYYKGFSVMRSKNMEESALIICNMANKIKREKGKKNAYYDTYIHTQQQPTNTTNTTDEMKETENDNEINDHIVNDTEINESKQYCNVIKKNKKENITKNNIGEIMLCQIPGVSSTIAIAILAKFGTIVNLIDSINSDESCLNDVCTIDANGKKRKVSKTAIKTIIEYLKR